MKCFLLSSINIPVHSMKKLDEAKIGKLCRRVAFTLPIDLHFIACYVRASHFSSDGAPP